MTGFSDIFVKGTLDSIQDLVQQAFFSNGFTVKWDGPGKGKAEKGSSAANFAFGALAQHYALDFEILPISDGAILRLHKADKGLMGGIIGVEKVDKEFNQMSDAMVYCFAQQGMLINVKKA